MHLAPATGCINSELGMRSKRVDKSSSLLNGAQRSRWVPVQWLRPMRSMLAANKKSSRGQLRNYESGLKGPRPTTPRGRELWGVYELECSSSGNTFYHLENNHKRLHPRGQIHCHKSISTLWQELLRENGVIVHLIPLNEENSHSQTS